MRSRRRAPAAQTGCTCRDAASACGTCLASGPREAVAKSSKAGVRSVENVLNVSTGPNAGSEHSWRIFLPGRVGPWRKRSKTLSGVKITERYKTIELPPSPNDRMHFQTKAALVKAWREDAKRVAQALRIPSCERIRVSAVLYRRALGTADEDNDRARLKPIWDGLRDAGVIANDTRGYIEHGPVTEERGFVGVLLIIEEIVIDR